MPNTRLIGDEMTAESHLIEKYTEKVRRVAELESRTDWRLSNLDKFKLAVMLLSVAAASFMGGIYITVAYIDLSGVTK